MNMNYKICFVCTGNACRSPFAECVTKKLLADAGMNGIEVFSLGTLDCGEYPRDAAMVDVAKELGYDLSGTTTVMTREKLMAADAVIVFDERHRDAITRVLDYSYWNKIVLFNKMALMKTAMWKTLITRLQLYIIVWLNTLKTVVNDW